MDAIITIDRHGVILSVNPATCQMFGYESSELLGENVSIMMPSPDRDAHDDYIKNYLRTGERRIIGVGREVLARRRDATIFPVHLAISEFAVGEERFFAGIVRDVSDLRHSQDQLREMNDQLEQLVQKRTCELQEAQSKLIEKERLATLGQLSGSIAHEIRNPLNALKTSAYFLLNARDPKSDKVREHLERIERQVSMIDGVVTAICDIARMPEPNLGPEDVLQLVREAMHNVAVTDAIRLAFDVPSGLPPVWADRNQLLIAFRNLIRNAIEAMPSGGVLTLRAQASERELTISVGDTGVGIAPEELPRIAEPMYTTKSRGLGLGLAISKRIIEKNAGRLEIQSVFGEGSIFSCVFPIRQSLSNL